MKIVTKFLLMMLAYSIVIIGGLFWTAQYVIIPWHVDTMTQKAREMALYVQDTSLLITADQLQKHVVYLKEIQSDLSYIVVLDKEGKALVHSDPLRVGMVFDDKGTLNATRDGQKVEQIYIRDENKPDSIHYGERVYDILFPFYDKDGYYAGAVNVGLSLQKVDLVKIHYYQIISVIAGLFVLLLGLFTYSHYKDVISPLSNFANMARRLGDGDPNHIIKTNRTDEIGMLAYEFNSMAQKITTEIANRKRIEQELRDSHKQLAFSNEELTATNEELRAVEEELTATNEELTATNEELSQSYTRMRYQAQHDSLTDLPNRTLLNERLQIAIANCQRHNKYLALMFLDLDSFKLVNDTMGHDVGDQLLKSIAKRLAGILGSTDTMARIGGDEFTIMLADLANPKDAIKVAERIIDSFDEPFLLNNHDEFHITSSIGISIYPNDGVDVKTLLKHADIAMYHAKSEGRNTYHFFDKSMDEKNIYRLELEIALRNGLERNEFVTYYQPQIDVFSGKIIGTEALLRWAHPQWGLLPPGQFIPIAEETGLIVPIGEMVLKNACLQNKEWQQSGFPDMCVAVNLSARQFQQHNLVQRIAEILEETGMSPQYLELEITESLAMQDIDYTIKTLLELISMGISVAIDDFGTGYSSLSYLKKLPINILKIDRTFIRDINKNLGDEAIVSTIINLAHELNLKVVAEGVETKDQLVYLQQKNCNLLQGYLFYKPMPAQDLTEVLGEVT